MFIYSAWPRGGRKENSAEDDAGQAEAKPFKLRRGSSVSIRLYIFTNTMCICLYSAWPRGRRKEDSAEDDARPGGGKTIQTVRRGGHIM